MDLPIDDNDLATIVWFTKHLIGAEELHKKLKLVKEVRDENPDGPLSLIHI